MFVDQLLLEDVLIFAADYYLTYAKKQKCRTYRYKSLKSWKVDNSDFHQFPLSIDKNHLIAIDSYQYPFIDCLFWEKGEELELPV